MLHWELHHDVELRCSLHDPVANRHPISSLPLLTHKGRSPLVPVTVLLAVIDRLLLSPHSFFDMDLLVLEDHVLNGSETLSLLQLTITLQVLLPIAPPKFSTHDYVLDPETIQVLVKKGVEFVHVIPREAEILDHSRSNVSLVLHFKLFMKKNEVFITAHCTPIIRNKYNLNLLLDKCPLVSTPHPPSI